MGEDYNYDYCPKQRYTLQDVYNAAKYEHNFDYGFWGHIALDIILESLARSFSYFLVIMAWTIIAFMGLTGFIVVIPTITEFGSFMFWFHNTLGDHYLSLYSQLK